MTTPLQIKTLSAQAKPVSRGTRVTRNRSVTAAGMSTASLDRPGTNGTAGR